MTTKWYIQIWIGDEKNGSDASCYEYTDIKLSDACDKAMLQFWHDNDYPNEPCWNYPDQIDFYISKVLRSQHEIQTIYTLGSSDSLELAIKEAS